ncbi:sensor domain-containing phosphodiesterase [Marinobacter oulmenensis]|uniref:Diguanylate cyclase (GGDEF)-like protein n=1 Tax=Marinobacter oulmenensis TaxID=643747 RepID=A0A840UI41_9GAMM|nr:EAL domain-containing protein [Marinobacter oulmenensis]MBB5320487.1 diguanylate cyclase (GGDEF)-like protein [Marinobacter oulmenensis]
MIPDPMEKRRLAALQKLGIINTPPEERFDRLVRIARQFYGVRTALFTVLDEERQWSKSRVGDDSGDMPRAAAFCDYAIRQDKAFIVEDAAQDPRFSRNPWVHGDRPIRFYAGVPVREPSGFKIGTLCIVDGQPRSIRETDLDVLRTLASLIEDELENALRAADTDSDIRVSHLGRAIYRAQNVFFTTSSDQQAFELMLGDFLALTGSEFGLIGEVLYREDNTPYLKVGAITNIAWSPETEGLFQQVERRGMLFERTDNLLGAALLSGEVVVANDYATDSRRGGLPPGHPPIRSYIGLPVYSGDALIGLVGLANRKQGYREQLAEDLAPLLQTLGTLIERKRLHEEKREHQKSLEQAAYYDALTGLPNRRRLTELFEQELFEADQRQGTVSVCYIDLDGFKEINDEHGHSVGDSVLRSISERLKSTVRAHDIIGRLGGDEFVAILRDVSDIRVYSRILESIRQPISYRHSVLKLSGSMGVTLYPDDDADSDLLLRHADQAMYAAKEGGKNTYRIFDLQLHFNRKERVRVLEQVSAALKEAQFQLYYQPKVDLKHRTVGGFEALLRWNHPQEGLVGPGRFLDYLEYTEYARSVGNWVISEGVQRLLEFYRKGLPYTISVNLSPSHFLGGDFMADLEKAIEPLNSDIRPRLILEILETTAMDDADMVVHRLNQCRHLGLKVSLDDFGTGYSSLDYFRRLPVNEIKVDRSFVGDMEEDPDDEMVIRAIIALSRSFGRRIVAEGIETQAVQEHLIELGCDVGQGYFYSRPMCFQDALAWADGFVWPENSG